MNIQGINELISAPLQAVSANSVSAKRNTSSSGGASSSSDSSDLQSMFLNLLVTELQNQDPTQPVDPTDMVGQMISLNELDQLVSINQILSGLGSTPTSGSTTSGSTTSAQPAAGASNSSVPNAGGTVSERASAPAQPLAFQPIPGNNGTSAQLMNLYNLYGNIGAPAANFNHITALGGK